MKEKVVEWLTVLQGFRKFLITILVITISVIFRIKALIAGNEFTDLVKSIGLGFIAANNLEGFSVILKDHLALRRAAGSLTTPPPDNSIPGPNDEVEIAPEQASGGSQ